MAKFSQRNGYAPLMGAFQHEEVDGSLRTQLWNALNVLIWEKYGGQSVASRQILELVRRIWIFHLRRDLDDLPSFYSSHGQRGSYESLKNHFMHCFWFEVFDFLEFLAKDQGRLLREDGRKAINTILASNNSAYRFVEANIAEITGEVEISAIESAMREADSPVRAHLQAALRMLSDKENPDFRNSVKESISAVEACCRLVTKLPSATLGDALKRVDNLHPAMSKAFSSLYGYTNDASGIRHALTDEPRISSDDARFMLIVCSAFVSYLKSASDA